MKTNSKRVAHVRDLAATCGLRTPGGRAPEAAWNSPEPVSTSGGSFPLATALSLGLGITHNSRLQELNPKGIPSLSPGLRAASYPGCEASKDSATLKGLKPPARMGFLRVSLLLFLACPSVCFGQRANEPRPAPLDPVQAEKEARALVAELLAQRPEQNTTNTGRARIRDAAGKEREIPMRFEITVTPTNWASVYETLSSEGEAGGMRLTVIHADARPNQYQLIDHAGAGATNGVPKALTPDQTMIPFAGSDFWVADLGLEFLHWQIGR